MTPFLKTLTENETVALPEKARCGDVRAMICLLMTSVDLAVEQEKIGAGVSTEVGYDALRVEL